MRLVLELLGATAIFSLGSYWGATRGVVFGAAYHRAWWWFQFRVLKNKAKEWRW